jgi:hypothetical protein
MARHLPPTPTLPRKGGGGFGREVASFFPLPLDGGGRGGGDRMQGLAG